MSPKPIQVEVMAQDAVLNIDLSSNFLSRMQGLLLFLTQQQPPEKMKESIDRIKEGKELNPLETHIETMLVFIGSVEDKARKDGLLTMKEVNPHNIPPVPLSQ